MVETLTVTDAGTAAKTGFLQEIENVVLLVNGPELWEPAVGTDCGNAPPPEHALAFCDDQVRVTALPESIAVASAVIVAVGAFHAVTVTLADAEPPIPEHMIV